MRRNRQDKSKEYKVGQYSLDTVFAPDEISEIQNLERQNLPGVQEKALERLEFFRLMYEDQAMNNAQADHDRKRRFKLSIHALIGACGFIAASELTDNYVLKFTGVAICYGTLVVNGRQLLNQKMGIDSVPYRGAEERLDYVQGIMNTHPAAPGEISSE